MFTVGLNTQGNIMNLAEFRHWTCDKWAWNFSLWDGGQSLVTKKVLAKGEHIQLLSEIHGLAPGREVLCYPCIIELGQNGILLARQGGYICGGCWCCQQPGKIRRFILSAGDMKLFCNLFYSVPGNICRSPYLISSFLLQGLRFSLCRHCTFVP